MTQNAPEPSSLPEVEKPKIRQPIIGRSAQTGDEALSESEAASPAATQPLPRQTGSSAEPDRRLIVYAGVAVALTLLAVAVVAVFGYAILSLFGGESTQPAQVVLATTSEPTATSEATTTFDPTATSSPGDERSLVRQTSEIPTPLPTAPPPPTPTPAVPPAGAASRPQLLADSSIDFSSAATTWNYLWAPPGSNEWTGMVYESRDYGTCWYAKDYVRICEESGHPGNGADIAWRWVTPVDGPIEILIRASKIDVGGDGVVISVYNSTTDTSSQPVFSRILTGEDDGGFANRFMVGDIRAGDFLFFVITKNEDVTYDHTAFQVTLCQISCP